MLFYAYILIEILFLARDYVLSNQNLSYLVEILKVINFMLYAIMLFSKSKE